MYFAVKQTLKIGNKRYVPCVCYTLTRDIEDTVKGLVATGKAYTSPTHMVYETGRRIDNLPKKPVDTLKATKVEPKVEPKVKATKKA